jgi:hypothetical protein
MTPKKFSRILLLMCVALVVANNLSHAYAQDTSTPWATTLPMQLSTPGFAPLVKIILNDEVEGTFLLATGDNNCYITDRLANMLHLSIRKAMGPKGPLLVEGQPAEVISVLKIRFGNMELQGRIDFLVVSQDQLDSLHRSSVTQGSIDGAIGLPFFQKIPTLFDYPDLKVTILLPGTTISQNKLVVLGMPQAHALPLKESDSDGYYTVPALIGNTKMQLLVDTSYPLTVIPPALATQLKLKPIRQLEDPKRPGQFFNIAELECLKLGTLAISPLTVGYYTSLPPEADWWDQAVLGTDVLIKFQVLYDLPDKQLYLQQPSSHGPHYGFVVFISSLPFQMRIQAVRPDSPAAKAGLQVGDIVEAINGQSISDLTPDAAMRLILQSPDPLVLQVKRHGQDQPVEIRIRAAKGDQP